MSQNPFRYVKALVIALVVFATILAVLPVAGVSSGDPGDDVGPAADTGVPRYQAFSTDPPYPGPSRPVDVTARVQDESDNLTVTMSYGYDNATWSAMSASRSGNMTPRSTVRNPVSGTTTGTLSATYSPNAEITFLNVYIYSADSDTCWVRIRGYEPISAAWTNLYSATNTGSGTKVNTDLWGSGYSQWDILFYDTEGNDAIYYTAMYDVLHQNYTATIPQAGTHTKVYYFFNASDPSGNNATSNVMNYSVDTTPPMIIDFTKPASLQRVANAIPIYTNVSDPLALGDTYLNYSYDGSTWYLVLMAKASGSLTAAEFVGDLPVPPRNSTVYVRIEAYDAGGNHNNTTSHSFQWDPPPFITDVLHTPANPNHLVSVNVSATVVDLDGLSKVVIKYSTDGSTWTDAVTNKTGNSYWTVMTAGLGNPWVYYKVWANDTAGTVNETSVHKYYVDRNSPRLYTPGYVPTYPNASSPVWVAVNVTDNVALSSVNLYYSLDNGGNWTIVSMSKASDVSSLSVGGYVRTNSLAYYNGLVAVGDLLGTWNATVSGYGGTPSTGLWTDVDVILLDGAGTNFYHNDAIAAARAGKLVVVNYNTWVQVRSTLGNPSYTTHASNGFTSWGLSLGRGAVVMTNTLTNRNYMGYSYNGYSATVQANLASHLMDIHVAFMPYSGQIPKTTTAKRVLFKVVATDVSGLSVTSTNYEYTTDGVAPTFTAVKISPSPLGWAQDQAYPVWALVTDETYLDRVVLHYSINSGSTWTSTTMTMSSGNSTSANYTGTIPATTTANWIYYYYVVYDRAGNSGRNPASSRYAFQTSDPPTILALTNAPTVGGRLSTVKVTATITDPDVVAAVEVYYRYGSGAWSVIAGSAGTNDRWSADVPSPGVTTTVYYYVMARDTVGVYATSSTSSYHVDGIDPTAKVTGRSVQYPNATQSVQVNGTATDEEFGLTATFQYRYGTAGTVTNLATTGYGSTVYTDRNPSSGTAPDRSVLTKTYDLVGDLTYLSIYIWSQDHDSMYLRVRGWKESTSSWVTIYSASGLGDGTRAWSNLESNHYSKWDIRFEDTEDNDRIYYNCTYIAGGDKFTANVPGPGYSTWVYYRLVSTDTGGNSNTTAWYSYWADGTGPTFGSHTSPGTRPADATVSLSAAVIDDSAIDRAVLYYSFGGSYMSVAMTKTTSNTTHLAAAGSVPATHIPFNVSYFFRAYDMAGNFADSAVYTYSTTMSNLIEGVLQTFDASNLYWAAGYKAWEWDFTYNGTFSVDATGKSVTHRYMDNGTYTVALRLTDNNDVVTVRTFSQRVLDATPTAFISAAGSVDEGTNLTLDGTSSASWPDGIVKYEWDLDHDGATFDVDSNASSLVHRYMENGTYIVALRVTDDDGSVSVATKTLTVRDLSPAVDVDFPSAVDEGQAFDFDASGTTSWPDTLGILEWDLDHSGIFESEATGTLVNHTYMDHGSYWFALRAYDDDGSYTQFRRRVIVRDLAPEANITAPILFNEGVEIDFNGSLSRSFPDAIEVFDWDFYYDGSFHKDATGEAVRYTYMDHGNYTVALRVRDDDGSVDVATLQVTVRDMAPLVDISGPMSVNEGSLFLLNATGSISFPDDIVAFEWDLDFDGTNFDTDATGAEVTHVYMDDGNRTVALRLRDDDGSVTISFWYITVMDVAPTAVLDVLGSLKEGQNQSLDGSSSWSAPDTLVSWEWDVDYRDGTFTPDLLGETTGHIYMDNGIYVVALRVTDDDGSTTIATRNVTIVDLGPVARLRDPMAPLDPVPEGTTRVFNGSRFSTSYPDALMAFEWWWDADGTLELGPGNGTLTFVPHSPGNHTIFLRVTDDDGSTDEVNVTIVATDIAPIARLMAETTPEGDPVLLNASATEEPGSDLVAFRWDLDGDGEWDDETTVPVLEHVWTTPGIYEVLVEVEDEDGSYDSVSVAVLVTDVGPVADGGGPYEVDEGAILNLSAENSSEPGGDIVAFRWDMDGDGVLERDGPDAIVQWSWDVAGDYYVTLHVEDAEGSVDTVAVNVTVIDLAPSFEFSGYISHLEGQECTFEFVDLQDPGTEVFQVTWFFGDGIHGSGPNVTHVYTEQGAYELYAEIMDNDGIGHRWDYGQLLEIANADPVITLGPDVLFAVEDEPFVLQVTASDTTADTITYSVEGGRGARIDPATGVLTWTPTDDHVGANTFFLIASDEDGGESRMEVTVTVEDVDNDFLGGMSNTGGSIMIILIILVLVIIVAVLYMRYRGKHTGAAALGEIEEGGEGDTVVKAEGAAEDAIYSAEGDTPDGGVVAAVSSPVQPYHGPGATSEVDADDSSALPPPPSPPPAGSGPVFNQLLEDRKHESELDGDDETEVEGESEWEVLV